MNETGYVKTEYLEGIKKITFFHPKGNSLPSELLTALACEITLSGKEPESRVIILQSEGEKVFCSGASFDELLSIKTHEEGRTFFLGFGNVILAMKNCPKMIIGRIQGKIVGGGLGIVSACDYTIAHQSASVRLSEFSLGIGPFVIASAVARKMGTAAFSRLTTDTEWYDSHWAKQNGLFYDVVDSIEELDNKVNKLSAKLAGYSPQAAGELKKLLWHGTDDWEQLIQQRAETVGNLVLSDFTRDYLKQFIDK